MRSVLLAALLCACASGADTPPATDADSMPGVAPVQLDAADTPAALPGAAAAVPPMQSADTLRGTVVVSGMGPTPLTTLTFSEGAPVIVTGALEPELRRLDGAVVIVHGRLVSSPRRSLEAAHYDIVEIDGVAPLVGTVQPGGTQIRVGTETLTLQGLTEPAAAGATIWVTGSRQGTSFRVQSWGIIRR